MATSRRSGTSTAKRRKQGLAGVRQRTSEWVLPQRAEPGLAIDDTKLGDIAKWMAGGFTLLAGLLTFFGIKEGTLDRILRTYPRESLLVFCLVGVAVLAGVLAPMFKAKQKIRFLAVALAVGLLGVFTRAAIPDFPPDDSSWIGEWSVWAAVVVLALAVVLLWDMVIPLVAASLIVGLACLTFGLYGAVKLSVASKDDAESPRVTAAISGEGAARKVTVSVSAAKVEDADHFRVELLGIGLGSEERLAVARLRPDAAGVISRDVEFPLVDERLVRASIRSAVCEDSRCPLDRSDEQIRFDLGASSRRPPVSASIAPGDANSASASFGAVAVELSRSIEVSVQESTASGVFDVVTTRLIPDSKGAVAWSLSLTVQGAPGNELSIAYRICDRARACEGTVSVVGTYRYPTPAGS